jgi:hypothetical protein
MARAGDVAARFIALCAIHVWRGGGQSTADPVHDRRHHFQVAQEFVRGSWRRLRFHLPLRFQKQLGLLENALSRLARAIAPCSVQLGGLPRVAVEFDERRGHLPAIVQARARYGSEKLHGHMGADLAVAHLLLNSSRKQVDQR